MSMKKLFLALIFFAVFSPTFSAEFSEYENSILNQIFQKRLEARKFATNGAALDFIKKSRAEIFSDSVLKKISSEAKITFENFFVWEEFHFLWEENPENAAAWKMIFSHYEKILEWNKTVPEEKRNFWYSAGMFEIINSLIPKLKFNETVKVGLAEKKFYDEQIKAGSQNALVFLNAALWYDFAPAVGGGSESRAKKYFELAVQNARSDYEKFFASFYFSQFQFDQNQKAECKKLLSQAEKILPASGFVSFVTKLNAAGFSYLEYTKNREDIEKKIKTR